MARRIHYPVTWKHTVKIPICDLADFLTDTEYEQMAEIIHEDVEVTLTFDVSFPDPEVGIPFGSFDFIGKWELCGIDNPILEEAVGEYLEFIDVDTRYSNEAYESYCDYCDYIKYGNI